VARGVNIKAKPDINLTLSPSLEKDVDSVGFANSCHEVPVEKSNEPDIVTENGVCVQDDKPPSEKITQVCDLEDEGGNNDKDNGDSGDNKNVNNVIRTSSVESKSVEIMEVVV